MKVLAASVLTYARDIYNGTRKYPLPTPSVPGSSAIARVAAVGADATHIKPGDLVHVDCLLRGRDDDNAKSLSGIHEGFSAGSKKMMHGEWRDSTYAEYARLPLENCFVLNEKRLLGSSAEEGLGYKVEELLAIATNLVPFGGLRAIGVDVSDNVIVSPATGSFGSAAVQVALAMGANVIAMGRNIETLSRVKLTFASDSEKEDRVRIVQITNDQQEEVKALTKYGEADVLLDISPPMAENSTHIKSAILSLRPSGRVCLMGGLMGDVAIPHAAVMFRDLTIKGKWMYEREDIYRLIRMVESGVLKLGKGAGIQTINRFPLNEWQQAFDAAAERGGPWEKVAIIP